MPKKPQNQKLPPTWSTLVQQLKEVLQSSKANHHQVTHYSSAEVLGQSLDLRLGEKGCDDQDIIEALQSYLHHTPRTQQATFNKLLFSGINGPAVLADWVSSFSNTTMHTYQVAPVASLMEREIIEQLNRLVGFDKGDGLMVGGGSMANKVAMMLARHRKIPSIKDKGFGGETLVAYVSELSHYSYEKAANILGIGCTNLINIKTDEDGCLLPSALEEAILRSVADGNTPFFIGLTAGTTVIGSFDPIEKCVAIAQKHDLWVHIDGAWGGPVLFSQQHRHLLMASELADSFTWDAHKLMNIPLIASAILVKDQAILSECCAGGGAAYLFHEDENAAFNIGTKSLQCGRRVDSLKFWASWKAMGAQGYAEKVDRLMSLKNNMLEKINACSDFTLLAPANFLNVLFRYEPTEKISEDKLAVLNVAICQRMLKEDLCFVDYAQYKGRTGIRYILANDQLNENDIDQFLYHCQRIGHLLSHPDVTGQ